MRLWRGKSSPTGWKNTEYMNTFGMAPSLYSSDHQDSASGRPDRWRACGCGGAQMLPFGQPNPVNTSTHKDDVITPGSTNIAMENAPCFHCTDSCYPHYDPGIDCCKCKKNRGGNLPSWHVSKIEKNINFQNNLTHQLMFLLCNKNHKLPKHVNSWCVSRTTLKSIDI